MLPEELEIISKLQRKLKQAYNAIGNNMVAGGVDNMEKYKYMLGQAHAYQFITQEISNLLKPKEPNDTEREQDLTNVVRFGDKD